MSFLRTVTTTVFCLAVMGAMLAPNAKADAWNRKTVITFSGPVEIPGVHLKGWGVLPAGTYVYTYLARASTIGKFQVVPPTAQEFYFPDVYGRGSGSQFVIQP